MSEELQAYYARRIILALGLESIQTLEERLAATGALLKAAATVACYTMSVPAGKVQPIADSLLLKLSQSVECEALKEG